MQSLIRSILILSHPLLAAACSISHEEKTCIYNGAQVNCNDMDRGGRPAPAAPAAPQENKQAQQDKANEVASCISYDVKAKISQRDAQRICTDSTEIGYCAADTMSAPISQVDAERLCGEGTNYARCVADAVNANTQSQVDAEKTCVK